MNGWILGEGTNSVGVGNASPGFRLCWSPKCQLKSNSPTLPQTKMIFDSNPTLICQSLESVGKSELEKARFFFFPEEKNLKELRTVTNLFFIVSSLRRRIRIKDLFIFNRWRWRTLLCLRQAKTKIHSLSNEQLIHLQLVLHLAVNQITKTTKSEGKD